MSLRPVWLKRNSVSKEKRWCTAQYQPEQVYTGATALALSLSGVALSMAAGWGPQDMMKPKTRALLAKDEATGKGRELSRTGANGRGMIASEEYEAGG